MNYYRRRINHAAIIADLELTLHEVTPWWWYCEGYEPPDNEYTSHAVREYSAVARRLERARADTTKWRFQAPLRHHQPPMLSRKCWEVPF